MAMSSLRLCIDSIIWRHCGIFEYYLKANETYKTSAECCLLLPLLLLTTALAPAAVTEANNYVLSLLRTGRVAADDIWVQHHGDDRRDKVINSMSPADRNDLAYMEALPTSTRGKDRAAIVVCHSVPTNWPYPTPMWYAGSRCPPDPKEHGWVYMVGRTMFETDRLPPVFVPR
jgi:hypothetical protein